MNYFLLFVIFAAILFIGMIQGTSPNSILSQNKNTFNANIADYVKAHLLGTIANLNLFAWTTNEDAMAIICVESGSYVVQGKNASSIPKGDNGQSIGYMQVKQNLWNTIVQKQWINQIPPPDITDLTNDTNNLIAGMTILDQCFAAHDGDRILAYQDYNNGSNKVQYANNVMQYYEYYVKGNQ